MNRTELVMRRRNVLAFINADPADVQFIREGEPIRQPGGGLVRPETPDTLAPQRVRIVHNTRRYYDSLVNSEAGEIPHAEYLLVARYDIDIEPNDRFWYFGNRYVVKAIHPFRIESTLAAVDFDGPANG